MTLTYEPQKSLLMLEHGANNPKITGSIPGLALTLETNV